MAARPQALSIQASKGGAKEVYKSLHRAKGEEIGLLNDCLYVLLLQSPSLPAIHAIAHGLDEIALDFEWTNYLSVIEPGGSGFDGEARTLFAGIIQRHSQRIAGAALICKGSGFRATAMRSIITALHLTSRAKHPMRVFASLEPALIWLKSLPQNRSLDVSEVRHIAEQLVEALER